MIEVVDARAPLPVVTDQPSRLEPLDVPGRRRPGMLEHAGDLTGRHRSALEVQRNQDPAAYRVSERREHRLVCIQPRFRFLSRRAFRHLDIFSAQAKYDQALFSTAARNSAAQIGFAARTATSTCW